MSIFHYFPHNRSSREDFSANSSVTNTPHNAPNLNFLLMHSQLCRGPVADALSNRKRNLRASDAFLEVLNDSESFDTPQHVGGVAIDVIYPEDSFHSKFIK